MTRSRVVSSFKRKSRAMSPRVPAARDLRSPVRERSQCRREIRSKEDRRKDQERGECRSLGLSSRRRLLGATLVPRGHVGRASFV